MIQKGAVTAGRCLRIPPRGEEQGEAEEVEHAGAYLNVVLPGQLACAAATHRRGESTSGAREGASGRDEPRRALGRIGRRRQSPNQDSDSRFNSVDAGNAER